MSRASKAAYHRKWTKANPLRAAEIMARYWVKKVEELKKGRPVIDVKD